MAPQSSLPSLTTLQHRWLMPALIIQAVPPNETGSATGLNTVLRAIGGSIGSAASIAVLSTSIPAGGEIPTDHGYTIAFLAGAVAGAVAVVLSLALTWRARRKERLEARVHIAADPVGKG